MVNYWVGTPGHKIVVLLTRPTYLHVFSHTELGSEVCLGLKILSNSQKNHVSERKKFRIFFSDIEKVWFLCILIQEIQNFMHRWYLEHL